MIIIFLCACVGRTGTGWARQVLGMGNEVTGGAL